VLDQTSIPLSLLSAQQAEEKLEKGVRKNACGSLSLAVVLY
jgi:hypothetical protein